MNRAVNGRDGFPCVPAIVAISSNFWYSESLGISTAVLSPKSQETAPAFQTPMYSGAVAGPAPSSRRKTRVISLRAAFLGVGIS